MTFYEEVSRFVWSRGEEIADAVFAQRVERTLSEMGYDLLPESRETGEPSTEGFTDSDEDKDENEDILRPEQVRYLESPYEGYRVMLKVDAKGGVTARLVRAVASEEEKNAPAADQEQKDREAGKKWCRDFDDFLEKMMGQDLPLDVSLRQEPEESQVLVVVDARLKADIRRRGQRQEKKRRKDRGTQALQERSLSGDKTL
jgi:hypothetical protein